MRKLLLLLALLIGGCSVSINSNQRKSENHDLTMKIASRWIQKDSDINEYSDFNLVRATIHSPILMPEDNAYYFSDEDCYRDFIGFYWRDEPSNFDLAIYSFFYTGEFTNQPEENTFKFIFKTTPYNIITDNSYNMITDISYLENGEEENFQSDIEIGADSHLIKGDVFRNRYFELFNCDAPFDKSHSWSLTDLGTTYGYIHDADMYFYSHIAAGIVMPGYSGYNLLIDEMNETGNEIVVSALLFYSDTELNEKNDWDSGIHTVIYKADGSRLTHADTQYCNEESLRECVLANKEAFKQITLHILHREDDTYALLSAKIFNEVLERVELNDPSQPIIMVYRDGQDSCLMPSYKQAVPQFNLSGSAAYTVNNYIRNSSEYVGYEIEINDQQAILRCYSKNDYNTPNNKALIVKNEYIYDLTTKQLHNEQGSVLGIKTFKEYLEYSKVR